MADYIRPTPRNPLLGLLSDALTGGVEWMRSPQRAQQMQGLGGLLAETGIPATVERMSYGEPLTKGRGMTTRLRPEAEAALMTLAPEAVPIGRAAMAGVRATKGLPVGAATVYHGSPYRFQRFDPTKIGSGEGAQAYGYGHYVAESPGVAKQYQETLSQKAFSRLEQKGRNDYRVTAPDGSVLIDGVPLGRATQVKNEFDKGQTGSLYTIDLPDPAIARMLDWDKPLGQQSKNVQEAIERTKSMLPANAIDDLGGDLSLMYGKDVMPQEFLNTWESFGQKAGGESTLQKLGVPGIRYLDQGSRSNYRVQNSVRGNPYGEPVSFMTEKQAQDYAQEQAAKGFQTQILPGTSNFVVFPGEEDLLRILSVEGGLLSP